MGDGVPTFAPHSAPRRSRIPERFDHRIGPGFRSPSRRGPHHRKTPIGDGTAKEYFHRPTVRVRPSVAFAISGIVAMPFLPCRRLLEALCAAAVLIAVPPGAWAQSAPDAVVAEIYRLQDEGTDSPIYEPELMDRFLTPDLIAMINADLDRVQGRIDFDPLYGADDPEVTDFSIKTQAANGDKAVVVATFKNSGKPTSVTFDLVRDGGHWKVGNIRSTRWDLRKLLQ